MGARTRVLGLLGLDLAPAVGYGVGGGVPTPSPPHPRVPQPCPSPTFKRPHPHPGVRPPNGQVSAQTGRYPSTPHGNARTNSRAGSCLRGGASPWQRVKPFGAAT